VGLGCPSPDFETLGNVGGVQKFQRGGGHYVLVEKPLKEIAEDGQHRDMGKRKESRSVKKSKRVAWNREQKEKVGNALVLECVRKKKFREREEKNYKGACR